ncbi:MAG: hypothetical protein JOZ19_03375 [Rubrobacter sp.]|nr:hypothetical protein [Rubrobacter sp.]
MLLQKSHAREDGGDTAERIADKERGRPGPNIIATCYKRDSMMSRERKKAQYRAGEVLVLRYISWEGVGAFGERLDARGVSWRYVDLFADQPLPDLRFARALLVMGGPMGVYEAERYPFLAEEIAAIGEAVRGGMPTVGVYLGSQLLAAALGAAVKPNLGGKEIGWGSATRRRPR